MHKDIYTEQVIGGVLFLLAEHLDDYRSAQLAAAEYRAEGYLCRVWVVDDESLYYVWVGPERVRQVRTLPHETIRRQKPRRLASKLRLMAA